MALTINILIIVLLSCSIIAVVRLWSVLGSARITLANLEETRLEANETLKRLAAVSASTDKIMREEVAPTLQQTRATLENVEMTTRALAQTTRSLQRLTGRAESVTKSQKLLALGGAVAQNVFAHKTNQANANTAPASAPKGAALAFAVVRTLLSRRNQSRKEDPDKRVEMKGLKTANEIAALPPSPEESNVLTIGRDTR